MNNDCILYYLLGCSRSFMVNLRNLVYSILTKGNVAFNKPVLFANFLIVLVKRYSSLL